MNEFFNPFNSYFHQFGVDANKDNETKRSNLDFFFFFFFDVTEDVLKKKNSKMYFILYTEDRASNVIK